MPATPREEHCLGVPRAPNRAPGRSVAFSLGAPRALGHLGRGTCSLEAGTERCHTAGHGPGQFSFPTTEARARQRPVSDSFTPSALCHRHKGATVTSPTALGPAPLPACKIMCPLSPLVTVTGHLAQPALKSAVSCKRTQTTHLLFLLFIESRVSNSILFSLTLIYWAKMTSDKMWNTK